MIFPIISGVVGFVGGLIFARSWPAALIIGALITVPVTLFHVYMWTGGLDGAGFDPAKLLESTGSLLEFALWNCVLLAIPCALAGLAAHLLRRAVRG